MTFSYDIMLAEHTVATFSYDIMLAEHTVCSDSMFCLQDIIGKRRPGTFYTRL